MPSEKTMKIADILHRIGFNNCHDLFYKNRDADEEQQEKIIRNAINEIAQRLDEEYLPKDVEIDCSSYHAGYNAGYEAAKKEFATWTATNIDKPAEATFLPGWDTSSIHKSGTLPAPQVEASSNVSTASPQLFVHDYIESGDKVDWEKAKELHEKIEKTQDDV